MEKYEPNKALAKMVVYESRKTCNRLYEEEIKIDLLKINCRKNNLLGNKEEVERLKKEIEEAEKVLKNSKNEIGNLNFYNVNVEEFCKFLNDKCGTNFGFIIGETKKEYWENFEEYLYYYDIKIFDKNTTRPLFSKKHKVYKGHSNTLNLISDGLLICDKDTKDCFMDKKLQDAMWEMVQKNIEKKLEETNKKFVEKIKNAKKDRKNEIKNILNISKER